MTDGPSACSSPANSLNSSCPGPPPGTPQAKLSYVVGAYEKSATIVPGTSKAYPTTPICLLAR